MMDQKEKITTLVNMGFSIDEAIALATGNYRTVPDEQPEQQPQQTEQPTQPTQPEQPQQPEQPEQPDQLTQLFTNLQNSISKLEQSIIQQNINEDQQPEKMEVKDILGIMLEPEEPAGRG